MTLFFPLMEKDGICLCSIEYKIVNAYFLFNTFAGNSEI